MIWPFPGPVSLPTPHRPNNIPTCDCCGEKEQDLEPWLLRCPATAAQRRKLFGPDDRGLDSFTRNPFEVVSLARSSLLGARPYRRPHTHIISCNNVYCLYFADSRLKKSEWNTDLYLAYSLHTREAKQIRKLVRQLPQVKIGTTSTCRIFYGRYVNT